MSIRTFNQLNETEKQAARDATQHRFLVYLQTYGIPEDPALWPPEPAMPFTKLANSVDLNKKVQALQGGNKSIYWVTDFLSDPELSAALDEEVTALVGDLRFRTPDTAPEDILTLS